MNKLKIAPDLQLPEEAVTQTFGIMAKRGSGKTYTAAVIAEEMLKANLHVVIIDPIGVWYGLRSSADGKKAGLPIIIAGGEHADIPLAPESGELLANMIIDDKLSMVVDVSLFRKNEQIRFMTDFAETLYRKNRQALHLILDEADAFAPQRPMPDQNRLLGAIEDIVRRGRARGLGVTMITQRPSVLNKNVLTQIEVLVALRLTAPIDQKAIDEWVKTNAEEGQREEFLMAISSLPIGTAYFWSPGWLKIFQKVHVRKRETLDSSSTPKAGKGITQAKVMAKVDIERLRSQLEAVQEKVKSDDPKILKKRIRELEAELAKKPKPVETVRVEVIPDRVAKTITKLTHEIREAANTLDELLLDDVRQYTPKFKEVQSRVKAGTISDSAAALTVALDPGVLKKGELRMLSVLGNGYPLRFTKAQMASLAKMKVTGGTFGTYYGNLKRSGYIEENAGELTITSAGLALLGIPENTPPKSADERISMWRSVMRAGEIRIFDMVLEYGKRVPIPRNELAELAGFEPTGGTFGTYLGTLRRNGLIDVTDRGVRASETLFVGGNV